MEFRILGPLAVEDDGRTIPLAGPKQRALLALLLLGRGRPVSTDRLIEEIWNGTPPETALKSVQVYVSQLRKALGDGRLVTRERGYELVVAPGEVDADRFDALVQAASAAAPEQACAWLGEALALFRGEPLADLQLEPWAQTEIARLDERRSAALEARIDADLALGRHRELVPELQALVAARPFRERFLAQLLLALYRSGRQADALDEYRRGAARLRNELGLEPGRGLSELEQRILQQDPTLEAPAPPSARRAARRRGWKLVLAGGCALLAATVAAIAVILTRGSSISLASVPPGVAIVDASNGQLVAQIPRSAIEFPAEVITGNGSFWVWNLDGYSMVRIDPKDGHILGHIGSPFGGDAGWYLVDGRSLWFAGSRLARIDIADGREADRYRLTNDPHDDGLVTLARGDGSLWVARWRAGELLRVDPATGAVEHRLRDLPHDFFVAYGDGAVWVSSANGISRIDPKTNTITANASVPGAQDAHLAVGGGYAWASNETKGTVYKIDRSGQIVSTYETGDGARQMSYSDGTLWVVNQDVGSVTGIDAATGAERTFRFGHPLQTVAALHGRLLVSINPGPTYDDRIDALKGKVARLIIPIYQFDHPDPAIGNNPTIFMTERATCAPLLGYPDAPPPRGQRLVPEAAAAMPTLSRDRRTYTFTVRTGFRFAPPSNAPLDAGTFRYSIERALSGRLGPLAPGISYLCPVPRGTPILDGGVGVYTGPAPPGAGPYTFSGIVFNGEYAILKRNPNYGGSRPQRLDAIGFREGIDTEKAVGRVEAGKWDAVEADDSLLAPDGDLAHRLATAGPRRAVSYRSFPARSTSYLALNARRPPFSNPRLRRAVATAIDRATLAAFWSQTPTDRLLPPAVRGAEPSIPTHAPPPAHTTNITVRMGAQAGDDRAQQFIATVRAALAPLGIDVRPVLVDNLAAALPDRRANIQLAALNTTIDYPDPASFLTQMLGRDVPSDWLPASVSIAVEHLAGLTGAARDHAALALADRLATQDVPVIAYATQTRGAVVGPRLGCRIWNGTDEGLDLAALCLKTP